MLLNKEILEMILGSEEDCNIVYNILNQSKRNHHGKITSINIPNESKHLFWRIITEFEVIHSEWDKDWEIAGSSIETNGEKNDSFVDDIVCGKLMFRNNFVGGEDKNYFLLKKKDSFILDYKEVPSEISEKYKLFFYYESREKKIIIKRFPSIKRIKYPIYRDGVLYVSRKKIDIDPHLLALYVLFLNNPDGIKKKDICKSYGEYVKIYEKINKTKHVITKESFKNNIDRNINKLNTALKENGVLPLYFIHQYECKNQGEFYFFSYEFLNNERLKRK